MAAYEWIKCNELKFFRDEKNDAIYDKSIGDLNWIWKSFYISYPISLIIFLSLSSIRVVSIAFNTFVRAVFINDNPMDFTNMCIYISCVLFYSFVDDILRTFLLFINLIFFWCFNILYLFFFFQFLIIFLISSSPFL